MTATGSTSSPTATHRRGYRNRSATRLAFAWHEVTKVAHYYLSVDAITRGETELRDE